MTIPERVTSLEVRAIQTKEDMLEMRQEIEIMRADVDKWMNKIHQDVVIRKRSVRGAAILMALLYVMLSGNYHDAKEYLKLIVQIFKLGG